MDGKEFLARCNRVELVLEQLFSSMLIFFM